MNIERAMLKLIIKETTRGIVKDIGRSLGTSLILGFQQALENAVEIEREAPKGTSQNKRRKKGLQT